MIKLKISSVLCVLALLGSWQNATADEFDYEGVVTAATNALAALTPPGTGVVGPISITSAGPNTTAGPSAITSIDVNVGGFCFTTNDPGAGNPAPCPNGGSVVPITSIDSAVINFDANNFPSTGSLNVTSFSPSFQISIPIMFDLTAGTFFADAGAALGTASGTGGFVVPPVPATIDVSSTTLTFPDTVIDNSEFLDVTVSNTGELDLDISAVGGVDMLAAPFAITADACSGQTLVAMASCVIQVEFNPTTSAPSFTDSFDIASTDTATPSVTVNVSGNVLVPDISVATDLLINATTVGETTSSTVTVTNIGGATLDIMQITNPMDTQFTVGSDTCSNMSLAALGTCTFVVTFEPTDAGVFMTSLDIPSSDPDTAVSTLAISGEGVITAVAGIGVSTEALTFAEILVGENATQTFMITSTGNADLGIESIEFSGTDMADFSQTNDCPRLLIPTATCIVTVLFEPLSGGTAKTATLTITSNGAIRPVVDISLSASAFQGPRINVSPTELSFGGPDELIEIGDTVTAATTVSNSGNFEMNVTAITFEGGDGEFTVDSEDCTAAAIPVEGSCTITVAFTPLTDVDKTATMLIASDDVDNPQVSVALSGFVFSGPRVDVPVLSLDVDGDTPVETGQSVSSDLTITSNGTQDLEITSIVISGQNATAFSETDDCVAAPIPSGQTCTITVTFAPATAGNKTALMTINSNDVTAIARGQRAAAAVVVTLTGTAVAPPPPPPPPLSVPPAFTGTDIGGGGSAGIWLLAIGLMLLSLRRRVSLTAAGNISDKVGVVMPNAVVRSVAGPLLTLVATGLFAMSLSSPVYAVSFESETGDLSGSWDTTISYGLSYRMEAAADDLIGVVNGGTKFSVNGDDGTLNFNRSIYSNALKLTSELELNYSPWDVTLFMRGFYFYDFELENGTRERTALSDAALDLAGSDGDLLDAFLAWRFELSGKPAELRIGEQVINWGESTFIQGGANVINHINVSALRVPGAELREALLPQDLLFFSVGLTSNADLELVYQYDWDRTQPDPVGTYFSTNDFAVAGGTEVRLGFGDTPDFPAPAFFTPDRGFNTIRRGPTQGPEDGGQYGFAFRYYAPEFNNGTEFGFYYYNYHSRLPLISARTGTVEGLAVAAAIGASAGFGGTSDIAGATLGYLAANPGDIDGALAAGVAAANPGVPEYAALGLADAAINGRNLTTWGTAYATDAFANTPSLGTDAFGTPAGGTAQFYTSYPEDIQMYAFSFNTTVGQTALQGEVAHHKNRPLQVDDLELLFAGLSSLRDSFAQFGQLGSFSINSASPQFNPNAPPLTPINGFLRRDYTQADFALTRLFGPMLGADQGVLLFEAAWHHVHGFPSKDVLRFDGPATVVSGNPFLADLAHPGKPIEPLSNFPDADSWGYRFAGRLDFNNILGKPINMETRFSWQHDVDGITPGPAGAFLEDRKALTLGSRFSYQNQWEFDISYTTFFGAGRQNEIHDRDFMGASVKYTF